MRTLLTTQNQNRYREMIMKEAYTRLTWKMKYAKDYPVKFTQGRSQTMDIINPNFNPTTNSKITLPPVIQPRKKVDPVPRPQHALKDVPLMRPVSPQSRETLYEGFSKEGKGRSLYLKRRVQKDPEEKFDYPVVSSWEYGWRLGDFGCNYQSPANGRAEVVRSNFYARNGVFNVPSASDRLG